MWCCTVQKNILLSNSLCLAELAQITVNGRLGVTVYLVFPSFNEWHRHQPSWPSKKSRFYFSLPPYSVNHQCPLVHHLNNSWILPLFPVRTWYRHCLDLAHPHEPAFQCSSPGDSLPTGCFFQCVLCTALVLSGKHKSDHFTLLHYIRFLRTLRRNDKL